MNLRDPDERSALAGEYVLGTFDDFDRRAFERQLEGDAALRAEVYRWHDRVLALSTRLSPVAPRKELWADIERNLLDEKARVPDTTRGPLWQRLGVWQMVASVSLSVMVALAAILLITWSGERDPHFVALLNDGKNQPMWVVEARPRTGVWMRPVAANVNVPKVGLAHFWTRMPGAAENIELGTLDLANLVEVPASRLPGLVEGQVFGVTIERLQTGPEDPPPGAGVLYTGTAVALPK